MCSNDFGVNENGCKHLLAIEKTAHVNQHRVGVRSY